MRCIEVLSSTTPVPDVHTSWSFVMLTFECWIYWCKLQFHLNVLRTSSFLNWELWYEVWCGPSLRVKGSDDFSGEQLPLDFGTLLWPGSGKSSLGSLRDSRWHSFHYKWFQSTAFKSDCLDFYPHFVIPPIPQHMSQAWVILMHMLNLTHAWSWDWASQDQSMLRLNMLGHQGVQPHQYSLPSLRDLTQSHPQQPSSGCHWFSKHVSHCGPIVQPKLFQQSIGFRINLENTSSTIHQTRYSIWTQSSNQTNNLCKMTLPFSSQHYQADWSHHHPW